MKKTAIRIKSIYSTLTWRYILYLSHFLQVFTLDENIDKNFFYIHGFVFMVCMLFSWLYSWFCMLFSTINLLLWLYFQVIKFGWKHFRGCFPHNSTIIHYSIFYYWTFFCFQFLLLQNQINSSTMNQFDYILTDYFLVINS